MSWDTQDVPSQVTLQGNKLGHMGCPQLGWRAGRRTRTLGTFWGGGLGSSGMSWDAWDVPSRVGVQGNEPGPRDGTHRTKPGAARQGTRQGGHAGALPCRRAGSHGDGSGSQSPSPWHRALRGGRGSVAHRPPSLAMTATLHPPSPPSQRPSSVPAPASSPSPVLDASE